MLLLLAIIGIPRNFQNNDYSASFVVFQYDWILHKKLKLVLDETFTIIHLSNHISLNIGPTPSILNLHIPEYPFPLAGHR